MAMIPMEYYGGGLTTQYITSNEVASIAAGGTGTFSFTIPSKAGYTPVFIAIGNFVKTGVGAYPFIPLSVCQPLTSASQTWTAYGYNATTQNLTNIAAHATVLYQPID